MADTQSKLTAALAADRAGNLDLARTLIRQHQRDLSFGASVTERIKAFEVEAKVLRHRNDAVSLGQACAAASHAVRLSRLPGAAGGGSATALAELELASCLLACDRITEGAELASGWVATEDAAVAGWAWMLQGEADLARQDHFAAIASLLNALAEFRRGDHKFRESTTRIALAAAFDRVGRVDDAAQILQADAAIWSGAPEHRRISIAYQLVMAENQRSLGEIAAALKTLRKVRKLLKQCTGMHLARLRMHQQFADCLLEWGQDSQAARHTSDAHRIRGLIDGPDAPPTRVGTPPPHAPKPAGRGKAPKDGPPNRPGDDVTQLTRLLDDARAPGLLNDAGVSMLLSQLARLHGKPGLERREATLLVETGEVLRCAGQVGWLAAERCLRRAQARIEHMMGMDIWSARASIELAHVLRDTGSYQQALALARTGIAVLNAQRFQMAKRRFRKNWLQSEMHRGIDLAIELAVRCGDDALAADLIIFSRASGVLVPPMPDAEDCDRDDIPLRPMPRLIYVDGSESSLGDGARVRFE